MFVLTVACNVSAGFGETPRAGFGYAVAKRCFDRLQGSGEFDVRSEETDARPAQGWLAVLVARGAWRHPPVAGTQRLQLRRFAGLLHAVLPGTDGDHRGHRDRSGAGRGGRPRPDRRPAARHHGPGRRRRHRGRRRPVAHRGVRAAAHSAGFRGPDGGCNHGICPDAILPQHHLGG